MNKKPKSPHFLKDIWSRNFVAYLYMLPSLVMLLILNLYPIAFSVGIAFTNMYLGNISGGWRFIGLSNFVALLGSFSSEFYYVLYKTFLFTAINVSLQVLFGLAFAIFYNSKGIFGKKIHLAIVILPWAIPGYISTLIWGGMFQTAYGAINQILRGVGLPTPNWLNDEWLAFGTYNVVNTWLAYPFMMTVILGALQGISPELYESATIDGARSWHKFRHITLPLIRRPLLLATLLTTNTTFQQFNVPFLLNNGGPAGRNQTVMLWGYNTIFGSGNFYGLASAFLDIVLIFVLIIGFLGLRVSRIAEEER